MSDPTDLTEEVANSSGVIGVIQERMRAAEDGRQSHEDRWLKAYKNFRGVYDSTTQYTSTEKSKVFIKITKTKVLAAYGQIVDILFANKKFPINIEATPVPEGIAEFAHMKTPADDIVQEGPADPFGFSGDGRQLPPGATEAEQPNLDFLGSTANKYGPEAPIAEGPSRIAEPQISPAQSCALRMEKIIQDQLTDTNAVNVLRHAIFESSLLGTGIIKGPFNFGKTIHQWEDTPEGRMYTPYDKLVPRIEAVSIWDVYPDPTATNIDDCEYVIQRHKMNRSQLRNLMNMPMFDPEAVREVIAGGGNYQEKYFEDTIRDDENEPYTDNERYEVLEYWGILDAAFAKELNIEGADELDPLDQAQVNIWVSGGQVLRACANPFTPERMPYYAFPYELSPYQIWGVGVPENMEDAQMLMNGHVRMAIDNLALAGNLVFDVDETSLVPGQNYDIFPGKVFRRQSGVTGTAVNGIKFPSTAGENIQMYDKARQLADEETGIPSIMHGQTGVTGTGRTASGLSMLLGSSGLSIKTVIKNIDDYLLKPMGEAFFQWNMQFNDNNPDIIGDLEIKPKGAASVMQKEVRSQRLTMLLQTVSNPMLAPFIKIPNLLKELAISQDIDPDSLVNDVNEAQIYAEILKGLQDAQQPEGPEGPTQGPSPATGAGQDGMGGVGGVPQEPPQTNINGTGDGTIGTGGVPSAGESGFTGNTPQVEG